MIKDTMEVQQLNDNLLAAYDALQVALAHNNDTHALLKTARAEMLKEHYKNLDVTTVDWADLLHLDNTESRYSFLQYFLNKLQRHIETPAAYYNPIGIYGSHPDTKQYRLSITIHKEFASDQFIKLMIDTLNTILPAFIGDEQHNVDFTVIDPNSDSLGGQATYNTQNKTWILSRRYKKVIICKNATLTDMVTCLINNLEDPENE